MKGMTVALSAELGKNKVHEELLCSRPIFFDQTLFKTYSDKLMIDNFSIEISKSSTPHHAASCLML
jgi:hypothetical protein